MSLDHRSFYFRQTDKKNITTKVLVDTIKELASKQTLKNAQNAESTDNGDNTQAVVEQEKGRLDGGEAHLQFSFPNRSVHKQVIRLLLVAGKRQFTRSEMVCVSDVADL